MTVPNRHAPFRSPLPDRLTASELGRLGLVVCTASVLAALTYLAPGLERLRPWLPSEGVPIGRLFGPQEAASLPEFAEAATAIGSAQTSRGETERSQAPPPPHRAAAEPPLQSQAPVASRPADEPKTQPQGRPTRSLGVTIDPRAYADLEREIESPGGGDPLARFYEALLRTAQGLPGAITRVAHYGDSAVAADGITHTMRRNLQQRFGDAGHGFMLIARGYMHYLHRGIRHRSSDDWELYPIVRRRLGKGWYGYGGVQYRGQPGAKAYFGSVRDGPVGTRVGRFEIHYQRHPRGGLIKYRLDRGRSKLINTRGPVADQWEVVDAVDGPHLLRLQVAGRGHTRLYGVVLERDGPGVVYDSLGLVGARARRLLNFEPEHIRRQIGWRNPDLLVLGFGGNEATDPISDWGLYERDLRRVVQIMRGGTRVACLLFAPLDQGRKTRRGRIETVANLPRLVEVQRSAAAAEGCAFFDTFQAMGGPRSIWRWYRARPRLALSDFRHATPAGYEKIGVMFHKALLKGFADYLARR
ncbi:MAG: GDSL-type esterase/lipase family protein [Proteobacteria bacterium]|nr:GDSL-type esterase/lipase family protein [Pseudomonadota bacterium]